MAQLEQIGFIGLGIMGLPMSENLMKSGYPLIIYNRTKDRADPLAAKGAAVAATAADVARHSRIIFICVGDGDAVSAMADSILPVIQPDSLVIDCSTISPSLSRQLAEKFKERGVEFLDAPCTGSKTGATNASLTFMVGGSQRAFERAKPYLSAMGQKMFHCGENGMGLQVKLTQNLILALSCQAMAEGFVLARKAGLAPTMVLEVIQASVARNPVIEGRIGMVKTRNFEPHFSLKWLHKDVGLMLESSRQLQVPLPTTALVHELFGASIAAGHGDEDCAAAITLLEGLAGVEVVDDERLATQK